MALIKLPRKKGISIQRILGILRDYEDLCDLFCATDMHLTHVGEDFKIIANNEQWYAGRPEIRTDEYDLKIESDVECIVSLISEYNTNLMREK